MARDTTATPAIPRPGAAEVYAPPREVEAPGDGPGAEELPGKQDVQRGTPWTITTYFAEGLPYSMVHQVSAELFTAVGASLVAARDLPERQECARDGEDHHQCEVSQPPA